MNSLTAEQLSLVKKLKVEVAPIVQADPALQVFCNEWTYVRYLRARNWNLHNATKMLKHTLEWRQTFKPHSTTWKDIAEEGATGKVFLMPFEDKEGRPIVMIRPRLENTKTHERQLRYIIYHLELASRRADELGVGKMTWLLDFVGYSMKNAPPISTSLKTLQILQNHFPERLGQAICYQAPSLFSVTYQAVSPFFDPITAKKIMFVKSGPKDYPHMAERFHMSKMEECMGGEHKGMLYNPQQYAAVVSELDRQLQLDISQRASKQSVQNPHIVAPGVSQITVT